MGIAQQTTLLTGFNPCCHGLAIAAGYAGMPYPSAIGFQSLLSWISHCGLRQCIRLLYRAYSFNPCCHGLAIAARHLLLRSNHACSVSILVVMD